MQFGDTHKKVQAMCSNVADAVKSGFYVKSRKVRMKLTPEQLADLKIKAKFHRCHQYGHWQSEHNDDGTLKSGVKSNKTRADTNLGTKKLMAFKMVQLGPSTDTRDELVGPLLDDGVPYSGIGHSELLILHPFIAFKYNSSFDPLPDEIESRPYCQHGSGENSSESRKLLGSVMISTLTGTSVPINIRYLIIEGSSQWVIGRNVTKHCNIIHIGGNRLEFPRLDELFQTIALTVHDLHSYIPWIRFTKSANSKFGESSSVIICATDQLDYS